MVRWLGFLLLLVGSACSEKHRDSASPLLPKQVVHQHEPVFSQDAEKIGAIFRVVNDSGRPITITDVSHECACTKAVLDSKELAPDQETQLAVEINTSGRVGRHSFTCYLAINGEAVWAYTIEVRIYRRIECSPDQLFLGDLERNTLKTQSLFVDQFFRAGEVPLELDFVADSPEVKLRHGDTETEAQGNGIMARKTKVYIDVTPEVVLPGRRSSNLYIKSKGKSSALEEAVLPIAWTLRSHFLMTPSRVFIGMNTGNGGVAVGRVEISRYDGAPFTISRVASLHHSISCRVEAAEATSKKSKTVIVSIDTTGLTEILRSEIILTTDDPKEKEVRIPCTIFKGSNSF
jgi:hypothetical protein